MGGRGGTGSEDFMEKEAFQLSFEKWTYFNRQCLVAFVIINNVCIDMKSRECSRHLGKTSGARLSRKRAEENKAGNKVLGIYA